MNRLIALVCFVSLPLQFPLRGLGQEGPDLVGAGSGWTASFEESQLCQLAGGQPLLAFVYREANQETDRFFRNLERWTGAQELMSSFCKAALRVEDHRDLLRKLGVQSAPCLLVLGSDLSIAPGDRVQGILTELTESEAVLGFLRDTQYESAENLLFALEREESASPVLQSATDYYQTALDLEEEGDPYQALALLQEAVDRIEGPTSALRQKALLKQADLAYGLGRLDEAREAYKQAHRVWDASRERQEDLFRVLYRLVLLLNDIGQNEEAISYYEPLSEASPDEKKEHIERVRELILGGYFVLADMGYPEVGTLSVEAPSSLAMEDPADRGDPHLTLEERLKEVAEDFDRLEKMLKVWYEAKGKYPNYLEEMSTVDPQSPDYPTDPFLQTSPYRYLHFEDPEEYLLYSVGPDGEDQWGESEYLPEQGESGPGDIVLRSPAAGPGE